MSWSASATSVSPEELEDTLQSRFSSSYPDATPEVKVQFDEAMKAVDGFKNVISGEGLMYASLNGHVHNEGDAQSEISVRVGNH